jgi:hypothetical protein
MTTTTKIELPEILIVRKVPIDVPDIQHRHVIRNISFDDLNEYVIHCKHIVELTAGRDLKEAISYDGGWTFTTDRKEEIKEWCEEHHGESTYDLDNFLAEDLANHLKLDDDEGFKLFEDSESYLDLYTVHKDGYYKLIKEDNDKKQLEMNFEKGFNNDLRVDPKGLERSIGSN